MAAELLPLIAELLARGVREGLKVKVTDEREGVLLEVEQEGLRWLVGEDGTVTCDECGWLADACSCED